MRILLFGVIATLMTLLNACGADSEESNLTQAPEQSQQGILSNQQQQALDTARGVEQTLLNSAADREKELEARLRAQ
jgi:ABC-type phosphate/phosphonate transport system substrate-binding protein